MKKIRRYLRLDKGHYCDAVSFDSRDCYAYMTDYCMHKCEARKSQGYTRKPAVKRKAT